MASKHSFFPPSSLLYRYYLMLNHRRGFSSSSKFRFKSPPSAFVSIAILTGKTPPQKEVTSSLLTSSASTSSRPNASSNVKRSKPNSNSAKDQSVNDWKEWFRSQEYDDPWSPYYSFNNADGGSPATSSQAIPNHDEMFKNIMDGTWKRRRHGMNLEPLTIKFVGYDGGTSKEESIFNSAAPKNDGSFVDDGSDQNIQRAKLNNKLLVIDRQSRFLCSMLDDLYRTGIRRQVDRPRTTRCHRLIGKLLTLTPKPNMPTSEERLQTGQSDIQINGLAQRANAILERMELCSPMALDWKRSRRPLRTPKPDNIMKDSTVGQPDDPNVIDHAAESERLLSILLEPPRKTYLELHDHNDPFHQYQYPTHLENTKHESPAPTRNIYTMVLLSFAKESGPIHVAQQAEDVIWSMIVRAHQLLKFDELLDKSNKSDESEELTLENLNPSTEHWNCALQCWSISEDRDRGFYAYCFLVSWLEWNKRCEIGESSLKVSAPDMTSYHSVLWACLRESRTRDEGDKTEDARAREMGSGVVIRLWRVVEKSNLSIDAASYLLFLRAICQTSELPSKSSTCKALVALARVFRRCCDDGMLSLDVLEIVRDATTVSQLTKLVGKDVILVDENGRAVPSEEILLHLPTEWTLNCD